MQKNLVSVEILSVFCEQFFTLMPKIIEAIVYIRFSGAAGKVHRSHSESQSEQPGDCLCTSLNAHAACMSAVPLPPT